MIEANRFQQQQHQLKIESYYTGKSIKQLAQKRYSSSLCGYEQFNQKMCKPINLHSKNNSIGVTSGYQQENKQLFHYSKKIKLQEQMQQMILRQRNPMSIFSYSHQQSPSISIQKLNRPLNFFKKQGQKLVNKKQRSKTAGKYRTFKDFLQNKSSISISISIKHQKSKFDTNKKNNDQMQKTIIKVSDKDFDHFPQQSILISPSKYQTLDINTSNLSTSNQNMISSTISTYNNQIHSFYYLEKQKYFKNQNKQTIDAKSQKSIKKQTIESISRNLIVHCADQQNKRGTTGHSHRSQFKTTIQLKKRPSTGVPLKKYKNKQNKMTSFSKNSSQTYGIKKIQFPNNNFEMKHKGIRIQAHPIRKMQKQLDQKKRYQNPQLASQSHTLCIISLKNSIKKYQTIKRKGTIKLQQFLPWDSKQEPQIQINNQF